ncbi:MAG: hypothetical protein P8N76_10960 [Pirellulaceae bacterium]|nr:hypothetical protein [Pirellulaceae bacterium]
MNIVKKQDGRELRISGRGSFWLFRIAIVLSAIPFIWATSATAAASIGLNGVGIERSFIVFGVNCTIAIFIVYFVMAIYLNRAMLSVTKEQIIIYRGPIPVPWSRKKIISTADVKQVIVLEAKNQGVVYSQDSGSVATTGHYKSSYEVWALLDQERKIPLIQIKSGEGEWWEQATKTIEENAVIAKRIEEEIEGFLGITDDADSNVTEKRLHAFVQPRKPDGYRGRWN